jgi:hypothetical protein
LSRFDEYLFAVPVEEEKRGRDTVRLRLLRTRDCGEDRRVDEWAVVGGDERKKK